MGDFGFQSWERDLILSTLEGHAEVVQARIFGSRAKGTHEPNSDIDLVLYGEIDRRLLGQILLELDELPLPYTFDVKVYDHIDLPELKDHIDRVGRVFPLPHSNSGLGMKSTATPKYL